MQKNLFLLLLVVICAACTKINNDSPYTYLNGNGFFVLNEGNFMGGNGSISFYSYDSSKIYNHLFTNINERPLGDVPNSMHISNNRIYVLVNNSGKIEVMDKHTLKSVATIDGLVSPRNIDCISNTKAYITSMYSDSVTILNLADNTISGYINLRRTSESIIISGSKAYIANWIGGKEIMVVDTDNDIVIDSITVGIEPESMVIDKNKMLWVLCNGGWARDNFAEFDIINTDNDIVENKIIFPSKMNSPSTLRINGTGETLYFLENGLKKMSVNSSDLPETSFITQSESYFYKLGINPVNEDIILTDAIDYQQKGKIFQYAKDGALISDCEADIIPSFIQFSPDDNIKAE